MARIKRVYRVCEMAHLWAAFNRGDSALDWARSGPNEYDGARFTGRHFYSEGDLSAVQCTAKSKARYVLAIPGRKHGVSQAVAAGNGRYISLPHSAISGRYNDRGELRTASALAALDLTPILPNVVKALIKGGSLRYVTEARWLAKQERLNFHVLLKEVLDADVADMVACEERLHREAAQRAERLKREQEEAAQRAANDRNPLVRALRGVSQAAMACEREARTALLNTFAWTGDLAWMADPSAPSRSIYGHYRTQFPVCPTLLRVDHRHGQIVTSRGASFPIDHALAAWPFILRAWERREEWCPKATTGAVLGHYRIDKVESDGTIYAGCHVVPFWSAAYAHYALEPGATPADAMRRACELVQSREA